MKKQMIAASLSVLVIGGVFVGCGTSNTSSSSSSSQVTSSQGSKVTNSMPAASATVGTKETQSIGLTGVDNARQLGGYVGKDGRKVKEDVILRTGKLSKATEEDISKLINTYHLNKIIDFRTTAEKESDPDPAITGVTNIPVSILDESNASSGSATTAAYGSDPIGAMIEYAKSGAVENMYVDIVSDEHAQQGYTKFFQELLTNENGSVLFHCTGGKDRAGIAGILLLSALGVDEKTALADFDLSNEFYTENIEKMAQAAKAKGCMDKEIEDVRTLGGVNKAYMQKALDSINEKYGSMDQYLKNQIKLTDADIKKLQDKYLEA